MRNLEGSVINHLYIINVIYRQHYIINVIHRQHCLISTLYTLPLISVWKNSNHFGVEKNHVQCT